MNIWTRLANDEIEYHNGKIRISPGGVVFEPSEKLKEKTMPINPTYRKNGLIHRPDATGKEMWLVHQRSIACLNPDKSTGYPKYNDTKGWCMPYFVCKKCEHYRKAERKIRYPHCAWLKDQRGGRQGAAESFLNRVNDAIKNTNEILGQ